MNQIKSREEIQDKISLFIWPELPTVSEESQVLKRFLPHTPKQISFSCGETDAYITVPSGAAQKHYDHVTSCHIGKHTVDVWHSKDLINKCAVCAGYDALSDDLPDDVMAIIAEHLASPSVLSVETALDGDFSIEKMRSNQEIIQDRLGFTACIDLGDNDTERVLISASEETLGLILALSEELPKINSRRPLPNISIPVRLFGPDCYLAQHELDEMSAGDGFLLEHQWSENLEDRATFGDHFTVDLQFKNEALHLKGPLLTILQSRSRSLSMSDLIDNLDTPEVDTDELLVKVSIELSQTQTTLKELRDLTTGSVIPFETDLPQEIRLLANGTYFATGELININDKLGVRVKARI